MFSASAQTSSEPERRLRCQPNHRQPNQRHEGKNAATNNEAVVSVRSHDILSECLRIDRSMRVLKRPRHNKLTSRLRVPVECDPVVRYGRVRIDATRTNRSNGTASVGYLRAVCHGNKFRVKRCPRRPTARKMHALRDWQKPPKRPRMRMFDRRAIVPNHDDSTADF